MKKNIPNATKNRFPQYLRVLQELKERGIEHVRSYQIGNMLDISEVTVRKDFTHLPIYGKTAYGYDLVSLMNVLEKELQLTKSEKIILIGVGTLGTTLLKYNFNSNRAGKIVCAFDIDPQKYNQKHYGVPVYSIEKITKKMPKDTKIAIIATPKDEVDTLINQLVSLKIEAIINFSDAIPRKRKNIKIYNIDITEIIFKAIYDYKAKK